MANSLAGTDDAIDYDDILDFDVSDEMLEAAAGMDGGPHKTGCTKQCPATSCG
jgi:hypothetical protein